MKFLIEKSILTPDEQNYFDRLSALNDKVKFARKFLKNHDNYENLKSSETAFIDSLVDDGFDPDSNQFLYFMEHIDRDLPISIIEVIKELIDSEKLDSKSTFLYEDSLYEGNREFILKKIKLLTLALDLSLQKGFSKEITLEDILDNGRFRSDEELSQLLQDITVDTSRGKNKSKVSDIRDILKDNLILDVVEALTTLGIDKNSAKAIALDQFEDDDTIESLIRKALKYLER